jgi:DUF2407 C-terminal domain/Ubiquitin family
MLHSASAKEDEKSCDLESQGDDDYDAEELDSDSFCDDCDDSRERAHLAANMVTLRVRSDKDAEVTVPTSSTVASLKRTVRRALQVSEHRYLRLIFRGRLLAPDSAQLSTFAAKDGDVVHAVIAAEGVQGGAQALLAGSSSMSSTLSSLSRRALRGTGLSATGQVVRAQHAGDDDDDDETTEEDEEEGIGYIASQAAGTASRSTAIIRHRGFDRLRLTMGLRRSQVAVLRAYFNSHIDRWVRNNPERVRQLTADIDDALLRRRFHEEAWMAVQGPGSEFRINLSGSSGSAADGSFLGAGSSPPLFGDGIRAGAGGVRTIAGVGNDRDFFWGFVLGFFVGFLMLFWVWMPTVPHKQKLGILTGISFQLALGMMKSADDDYSDDTTGLD